MQNNGIEGSMFKVSLLVTYLFLSLSSPWNTESCPTDVKDFVLAHFKNEMIQSDLKEVFKTAYESMKNTLMDENLDEWKHDIDTMVDVGFQAVFDTFKPEDVCDFYETVKDRYEL